MKVGPLLAHLEELEASYAETLRSSAQRFPDEHDVFHQCLTFAAAADRSATRLGPLRQRYDGKAEWQTLVPGPGKVLLEELRALYLLALEVAVTWSMALQAGKGSARRGTEGGRRPLSYRGGDAGEVVPHPNQGGRTAGARGRMTETRGEAAAREELTARTRIILRPLAGPLALGFFGLAGATFVVAGLQLGWVAPTESRQVALCVLAFTVPLQFTTSIFGFLARDGVAATGMGLLSGIWAAIGLVLLTGTPASTSNALGLFLVIAGIAMWAPASAAAPAKLVPALVLATAGLRFVLTGIYEISGSEIWENTAGVVGLILAALAVYAAYAAGYEDILKRPVLSLGRRGKGRQALEGTYAQQVAALAHEPGVRQQL